MSVERLDDLFRSFARELRAANKAERTVELYGQSVRFYAAWLEAQGRPATTDSLTRHAITGWLADLGTVNSPSTVRTRYRGLRRFTRWCVSEGVIDADPMSDLEVPAIPDRPVPVLSDDEIAALLKATSGTDFTERRDHAILRLLMDCGLRISEVAALRVVDVDLRDHDVVHVMGKGRRPRAVPFGSKTGRALDKYLRARRAHPHADTEALWLGQRGPMSVWGVEERLKVRAAQAGVEDLHAHRFRHTFAHQWLAHGGQEQDLKRLAGWTSDAMLAHYGRSAADERARDAHRRMRLGDRL